jgi:hypothetical protein
VFRNNQDVWGTFQTLVNGDGTGSSLKVSGDAVLGGHLQVSKGTGISRNGQTYNILTSSSISGTFKWESLPTTALLSFSTSYLAQTVQVISNVKSFATIADTPLENMLAQGYDQMLAGATGDFANVLGEF